jgi:branched-chain amino acid transport system substrate-binding protein
MRHHYRAKDTVVVLIAGILAFTAGCSAPGGSTSGGGGEGKAGTVTVGLLRPSTGPLAANGKDMEDGWNLYWEQNGDKVGNTTVKTIVEDTAGNPSVALNKANQLVSNQGADMVVGPLAANVGLAVADAMDRKGVTTVMPIVSADDLTQRKTYAHLVRLAGWSSSQTTHPFGEWAYDEGYRNVLTIGYDFAFGYEGVGGFVNTFTDKGGKIVKQLWPPLGTQDYSSYVAQIKQANPDAVFAFLSGADDVRFFKAYQDFGLLGKTPLLGGETVTDQSVLQNLGAAAVGLVTSGHWAEGRDDPATKEFVDAYYAKYNKYPSYYSVNMYSAAKGIAETIQSMNGDISDQEAFIKAMKTETLSTPMGTQKLGSHGNPVFNVYIRKVEQGPHGPWNVTTKTYENVSQFWTYDPEEFLKHPVYSKSYQGNGVWPDPQS